MISRVAAVAVRRFPALSRMDWRYFSEGKGRILSEEEQAKENVYIKKMEQERIEKLKKKLTEEEKKKKEETTNEDKSSS